MNVAEAVVGGILAVLGLRSLVVWMRRPFDSRSFRDHVLYALFRTGRIGVWFTLAAMFFVYAFSKNDRGVRWMVIVPIALAGVSTLSAYGLGRED
jgi:hypothetical protein